MFPRLLLAIVCVGVLGATLLSLRQQRLVMMHEMAGLHAQIDRDRKATWRDQSVIAEATHPAALREALSRRALVTVPLPSLDADAQPGPELMPYHNRLADGLAELTGGQHD